MIICFRYFVQPAVVERKLSSSYPITRDTIKLIEDVLSKVLDVPGVNLSITPRWIHPSMGKVEDLLDHLTQLSPEGSLLPPHL